MEEVKANRPCAPTTSRTEIEVPSKSVVDATDIKSNKSNIATIDSDNEIDLTPSQNSNRKDEDFSGCCRSCPKKIKGFAFKCNSCSIYVHYEEHCFTSLKHFGTNDE